MSKSRIQRSEIPIRTYDDDLIVIVPKVGRKGITVVAFGRDVLSLSPEEAYTIGGALMEHATECGYDYDTGQTHPVS